MPSILDPDRRRPPRTTRSLGIDPMVGEIAEVLLRLGGSAHRDEVIACLSENRACGGMDLALRARAMAVFDAHSRVGARRRTLFRKPFGPGLNRWALTAEAEAFLRTGGALRVIRSEARI
jgi:hypothetical protein